MSATAFDLDDIEPWPDADPLDRAYRDGIYGKEAGQRDP